MIGQGGEGGTFTNWAFHLATYARKAAVEQFDMGFTLSKYKHNYSDGFYIFILKGDDTIATRRSNTTEYLHPCVRIDISLMASPTDMYVNKI
jgi:hypothetical protein